MTVTISGTSGVTYPAGGVDNTAGAGVGTTDTQTLTNKTLTAPTISSPAISSPTISGSPTMSASVITSGTAVASTSGTSIDFTGIPSWVKRITVMFDGVSTNGASGIEIRLGDSGGIESTGYTSAGIRFSSANSAGGVSTTGFNIEIFSATYVASGLIIISKLNGNTWTASGSFGHSTGANFFYTTAGSKTLSDTLTQVRIATTNGTDTFDAGTINIMYE